MPLAYAKALRRDRRRTPGSLGRGPDSDSPGQGAEGDNKDYGHREDAFSYSSYGGFWKRSEHLACRQGHTMRTLNEREHFSGPTWQRAHELRAKANVVAVDENNT